LSLQLAKNGRERALSLRQADRKLIAPASRLTDVILPKKGSLDAGLLMVLHRGVSVERLSAKSGWSSAEVMSHVFQIVKRARLGLERRGGELFLVYPEADMGSGNDADQLRQAVQARRAETLRPVPSGRTPKADVIAL
jgi:hypothetical protein